MSSSQDVEASSCGRPTDETQTRGRPPTPRRTLREGQQPSRYNRSSALNQDSMQHDFEPNPGVLNDERPRHPRTGDGASHVAARAGVAPQP